MYALVFVWWLACFWTMTSGFEKGKKFTNLWIAKIHGGDVVAERVARSLGFTFKGQASDFMNHYELTRDDQPEVSENSGDRFTRDLLDFDEVKWAKQQVIVERVVGPNGYDWAQRYEDSQENRLMDFLITAEKTGKSMRTQGCSSFFSCLKFPASIMSFLRSIGDGGVKNLGKFTTEPLDDSLFLMTNKGVTKNPGQKSKKVSAYAVRFNDPNWRKQWYLHDYRTSLMPVMDHNVVPVHKMGYTGKKIKVAILDNGVQHDHPDLKANFDESRSYDVCQDKPGSTPMKTYNGKWPSEYHGTSCAGVIAMVPGNKICGVGIAYDAKVAGILMICSKTTEYVEAKALGHTVEKFDIYSNSWTPPDNGFHLCTLDHMVIESYIKGTTKGRKGKGVIYIQSTGNGRDMGNNCAANCYVNHPYAIGITSANQMGKPASYSDRCTAIFATAYSGCRGYEGVTTLNGDGGCNTYFSGTSAAVPIAAGIIALVLDSKPELEYRDVMHLIAMTAEVAPLADNEKTWNKNGRELWVSNDFGFGLLNAENMVRLAKDWVRVPTKHTCTVNVALDKPEKLQVMKDITIPFETDACMASETENVNYLEHIEVTADVRFPTRGAIALFIRSPLGEKRLTAELVVHYIRGCTFTEEQTGTVSTLLEPRPGDINPDGLEGWNIMSVHNWGEDPKGEWQIKVIAVTHPMGNSYDEGEVHGFTLRFHGTADQPDHYNKPRRYAAFRLPDGRTSEM